MAQGRRLLPFLRPYRRAFVTGLVCVVAATAIQLASPWVLLFAVDDLTAGITAAKLRFYAGLMLGLAIVGGVFRYLMRRILIGASREIEYDLRNHLFAHLQRLSLGYFQASRTGDLMSRATSDLSAVRMMIGPAVMYTSSTALTFVVAVVAMASIDWRLTLVSLVPLPLVSIAVRYFGAAIHQRFEGIQAQLADLSAVTQEALAGVRVVRAYGREPFEIERFETANAGYVEKNRALIRLQGTFFPSIEFLMGAGILLVLWLGSRAVVQGRITVGELVAFNAYVVMLSWPMMAFGFVTNLLQRGLASWSRMTAVLDASPEITDREAAGALPLDQVRGEIETRHLTVAFGDRVVLRDVSAVFPAGRTTAIVGATGSGKSTLLSLLPRLYEAPSGTVFLDGVDVRRVPLGVLRGAIGFVPQEPFLFSDTLGENIAFGARGDEGSAERVEAVGRIARLDKDLEDLPRGYRTIVGERGITLSGGQKQRASIARALIGDPAVLVLDDALSAVDTYTEEEILVRLREARRGRTTILVSHRISTVRDADQILVLDDGRIVERGRHDDLVAAGGLYADLHRRQLLEDELAAS
ncbi:MAG: ABC transporter ATP-binding protein [Acidimicrobiia bacterium]|nr:ABC transporter ATP-binding protein [Acidimicrobiia bacterium]